MPAYDLYLYAVWQPQIYEVSYQYDTYYDGSLSTDSLLVDGGYGIYGTKVSNSNLDGLSMSVLYGSTFYAVTSNTLNSVSIIDFSTINNETPTNFVGFNISLLGNDGNINLVSPTQISFSETENGALVYCDITSLDGNYFFEHNDVTYILISNYRPDGFVL